MHLKNISLQILCLTLTGFFLLGASQVALAKQNKWPGTKINEPTPKVADMPAVLAKHLANFDDLDFHVYSKQDWKGFHKSHDQNIVVYYPDGSITKGLPDHIKALKFIFTFAPDTHISQHPVRFGTADGQWTAVMGYLDGTFTKPMVLSNGKVIQPTGKSYHLQMATLGHWGKNGLMDKEYLFWDNAAFMKQIGAGQ